MDKKGSEIQDANECPPHSFLTYRFIYEEFDRKVCEKCGICPVRIPDGVKLYKVRADGSETLIKSMEDQGGA